MNHDILIESRSARSDALARFSNERIATVLEKAKALIMSYWRGEGYATTSQLAEYFEVSESVVRMTLNRHKDEFKSDGVATLKRKELEALPDKVYNNLLLTPNTPKKTLWTSRSALRLAMLLTESEVAEQIRGIILDMVAVVPQQSEELEILKLQNEMLSKQLELRHLDNTMLTLHGKQTVLVLRGYDQAIVEVETVVTEVVEPETKRSTKILSANQLKRLVKEKTGQNVPSLKWFTDQLRKHGRDDLLTPVTRHVTGEYPVPERINEAIEIVFEKNRQMLLGE